MNNITISLVKIIVILQTIHFCSGYKILALQTFGAKSHYINFRPILKELAKRGHDLTFITTFPEEDVNYNQIIVERQSKWEKDFNLMDIINMTYSETLLCFMGVVYDATEYALRSKDVQNFIKNDDSNFDLIVTEIFFQPSMYMFAHKYNCPIVGFYTSFFSQSIMLSMGNPLMLSHMTHEYLQTGIEPSFIDKLKNIYLTICDRLIRYYYLYPRHQNLAEKYFGNLPQPLPKCEDIEKNFSAVFMNTHFSIDDVRPYVPGIIEVGGIHIQKPKRLPEYLQKYLDEAKDGTIYFSLGSTVRSKDMAKEKVQMFKRTLGKFKQRVLWKWEEDTLEEKPDNILIEKWMPQSDILAHPNIKLFITHGGLLGMQEAIYHGVPLIAIPIYGDQFFNSNYMVKSGFGLKLSYENLTEDILERNIQRILNDRSFKERAKEISFRFKDTPMSPVDTAIYWIEYVVRQKGAKFMRSPVLDMSLFEYYMVDIWLVFITFILVTMFILYKILLQLIKLFMSLRQFIKYVANPQNKKRKIR